ncbi:unnamed protein product [Phaedon cochleariae]|uniref:Double jelly roll-like domain-containing protein n=1 Tax=Phaedon cochleariae TaxID=80249 RepID=A0A9N9SDH1_PHACE|nr:unnamed protein product [Phaedon cochleariae]
MNASTIDQKELNILISRVKASKENLYILNGRLLPTFEDDQIEEECEEIVEFDDAAVTIIAKMEQIVSQKSQVNTGCPSLESQLNGGGEVLTSTRNVHQAKSVRLPKLDLLNVKIVERANTASAGSPQTQSIAEITIESINLKVPHLTHNDDIKLQLLTRIKADESMMIPFRRWELHELIALTQGSTIEIWSVKTCSALDSPRYVIVVFQTKKVDNLHEDVTLFDNANMKSIRLALNSDYYPQEKMLLDFSKDQYADAHFNYTEFNKSYHNCQEKRSLVNFAEFKSRPMFVIDCSRRYLGLKSSTVDMKVVQQGADFGSYCRVQTTIWRLTRPEDQ